MYSKAGTRGSDKESRFRGSQGSKNDLFLERFKTAWDPVHTQQQQQQQQWQQRQQQHFLTDCHHFDSKQATTEPKIHCGRSGHVVLLSPSSGSEQ
ncbi:unnamed protein product, partial [Sphacelaria rigidula]